MKYNEEQKRAFVELAGETGLTAAKRTLGYPNHWVTAKKWCDDAGVEIVLDELKQKAAEYNSFYQETELLIVLQESIQRARELMESQDLTPGEHDKLVNGIVKATNSIQMLRGKATNYRPSQEDTTDAEALKLYDSWKNGADHE
ncbi:hypothetical protein [Nocardia sp. NPDC005366]|uniref:hypothetical protein n=1 Tax=Nocardia sp. NPDC005366 TaxID=3156878 RepID=UPI0033A323D7